METITDLNTATMFIGIIIGYMGGYYIGRLSKKKKISLLELHEAYPLWHLHEDQ